MATLSDVKFKHKSLVNSYWEIDLNYLSSMYSTERSIISNS